MGLEGLTQLEILQGIVGLISLGISFIVAFKIISKYFTYKRPELITVGLMMLFVTSGWWGSALAFIMFVVFNLELSDFFYIFISYGFVSLSSIFWLYSFAYLVYPKSKWKILSVWLAISILYTILFIYYILIDPSVLAIRITRFDTETRYFVAGYILLSLLISLITQAIFLKGSISSKDKRIRWKGKFIFLGFSIFLIGAVLDSVVPLTSITLLITRILLITSSIVSYIGWIMPERVANWLVKE
ncbi:MAG: hypothetical protein ACFFHV_07080 [Promethearchaeota archaeon]